MRALILSVFAVVTLSCLSLTGSAQSSQKTGAGVITGRITAGDKALPGVNVLLLPIGDRAERKAVARSTTDFEGRYRLLNVPAGRYSVTPVAPTMVVPDDVGYGEGGRMVVIAEGESVEKIDFSLTRGGVVTGRITDSEGKPVVDERVRLEPVGRSDGGGQWSSYNPFLFQTDDRGVYRIYGVPPGRYTVSVGQGQDDRADRVGYGNRGYFERTYYPGEVNVEKATIIEIASGSETKDVDIKLGRRAKSFTASGRVVDAATGEPLANLSVGQGSYRQDARRLEGFNIVARTNASGQFRLDNLAPGRYAAFVWSEDETYSDPVPFEITDADVGGLEIRLKRGASISGTVQVEGTSDKRILARLQQLTLTAFVQSKDLTAPSSKRSTIGADGQFRLSGLVPGKVMLHLYGYPPPKDFRLVRVERDGVTVTDGMSIKAGEEISNVRVIIEYGSGQLRGLVRVENGSLPEGTRMWITLNRQNDETEQRPVGGGGVDARGRFLVEGLATGDYQLILRVQFPPDFGRPPASVKQTVSVTSGIETEVTVVLDLTAKEKEGDDK